MLDAASGKLTAHQETRKWQHTGRLRSWRNNTASMNSANMVSA